MNLYLTALTDDRVEFTAFADGAWRAVTVLRHGDPPDATWNGLEYPHVTSDAGRSLGSEDVDRAAKLRAFEELVRLQALARELEQRAA